MKGSSDVLYSEKKEAWHISCNYTKNRKKNMTLRMSRNEEVESTDIKEKKKMASILNSTMDFLNQCLHWHPKGECVTEQRYFHICKASNTCPL
jgi:hypothetical protein